MGISRGSIAKKVLIVSALLAVAFLALSPFFTKKTQTRSKKEAFSLDPATSEHETAASDSYYITPTRRASKKINISIIVVYTEGTPLQNYETALNTVECYAKTHAYPFHLFSDAMYEECAKHKDLFFRRHCCIAHFMEAQMKEDSWLLVLDGDIAVVNPKLHIEAFIDANYDITLFDRFFNFEVGANSYLVRNTQLGRAFVQRFADYEFKLPNSFHGTDNGALHPFLAELLVPENARLVDSLCAKVWRESKNYRNLFEMEVCTRLIFGDRTHFAEKKLRILPKGKAWVRDVWLLKSRWAEDDFMLHAVKEKQLAKLGAEIKDVSDNQLYQWDPTTDNKRTFPLKAKLNITKCELGEERWNFDSRLKISAEKKAKLLDNMEKQIFKKRLEAIGRLARNL